MWEKILASVVVAAVVAGAFGLGTLLLNRHWAKKDKQTEKLEEIYKKISGVEDKLDDHIQSDNERYATECRGRILSFASELINEPGHRHTKGQFDAVLGDITHYNKYCEDHPNYQNEMTDRSIEIIRQIYDECAREHKFL